MGCYGLGFTGAGKSERRYLEAEFEGEPGEGVGGCCHFLAKSRLGLGKWV